MVSAAELTFVGYEELRPLDKHVSRCSFKGFFLSLCCFLPQIQICWGGRSLRCWLESYRILFFLLCFDLIWFHLHILLLFKFALSKFLDICLTLCQPSLPRVFSLLFTSVLLLLNNSLVLMHKTAVLSLVLLSSSAVLHTSGCSWLHETSALPTGGSFYTNKCHKEWIKPKGCLTEHLES